MVKKQPAASNSTSRQRGVRIRDEVDDFLQARATANPGNRYNQLAFEVNAILDKEFQRWKKNGKRFAFRKVRA